MNLTKTYRGKTTNLKTLQFEQYQDGVTFCSSWGRNSNRYTATVSVYDYRELVKKTLRELRLLSGMDYCIMAKHPKDATWRQL